MSDPLDITDMGDAPSLFDIRSRRWAKQAESRRRIKRVRMTERQRDHFTARSLAAMRMVGGGGHISLPEPELIVLDQMDIEIA